MAFLQLAGSLGIGHISGTAQDEQVIDYYINKQHKRVCALRPVVEELRKRYPVMNNYELLGPEYYDAVRHPTCASYVLPARHLYLPRFPLSPRASY